MLDDVEALLAAINKMAEAEKVDIADKARQEVDKINKQAEAEVERLRLEAIVQLEGTLCAESEAIVNNAKRDIDNKLEYEKNKALEKVFDLARQNICQLDSDDRKSFLKRLITDAINRIDCDDVCLRISNDDLNIWESIKNDFQISISVKPCDRPSGTIIVETADGSLSIDNSIDTRLEIAKDAMRAQLCDILFANENFGEMAK